MNLYTGMDQPAQGHESFEHLLEHPAATIERISSNRVSQGEWYDQAYDEWVVLLRGSAVLEMEEGKKIELREGDILFIRARERHRVLSTSENALWLAVHLNCGIR